jgi:hypothetical protein
LKGSYTFADCAPLSFFEELYYVPTGRTSRKSSDLHPLHRPNRAKEQVPHPGNAGTQPAPRSDRIEVPLCIAAALEIDSPQLFSMATITEESVKRFQEAVLADIQTALTRTEETRAAELSNNQ